MKLHELYEPKNFETDRKSQFLSGLKMVAESCSEFLQVYKKSGPMYHGYDTKAIAASLGNVFVAEPRKDRNSLSMDNERQKLIDDKLIESGFDALRCNSLFCTGDIDEASAYGALYRIFPINGYKFTWSKIFRDLVTSYKSGYMFKELRNEINCDEFIYKYEFLDTNLNFAIKSGNEIYVNGKYVAISNFLFTRYPDTYDKWEWSI